MTWIAVDVMFDQDPKIIKLDGFGRALIQFIWRKAKATGRAGNLSIDYWDLEYLTNQLGFRGHEKKVHKAMDNVRSIGLLHFHEDSIDIPNWHKYQTDSTNAKRQSRFRDKQRVTEVTLRNGSNADSTGHTVQDIQDKHTPRKTIDATIAASPGTEKTKTKRKGKSNDVWNSYSRAYKQRYGVEPVRNAKVNTLLCQFVDRLGAPVAPSVADWYLHTSNQYYAARGHPVDALVRDCEKLHTEWRTQTQITQSEAREKDRLASMGQKWARVIKEKAT